ncbi:rhodanese-like domain-containing protein [Granulosicoccus antarcticus]|uniref:rhodanese-like domain-containing protein n=1 Tax=Granulosicoccus antarcticus TaxID=437505 RepID=UPI0012FE55D7|nr:rhodanese-like domain-containing protein [Granulosicoccus antarcticus]
MTLLLCLGCFSVMAVEEPAEYRMERYDDEVPDTLSGAVRISAVEALELQQDKGAVIVDVIPEHRQPEELPEDQLWLPVPHEGVAGAVWLPDVGYGLLSVVTETYFRTHLEKLTEGDLKHALVFYCRTNCWMSWNAAKRALEYGYSSVFWLAEGIEDWKFEGYELEMLEPAEGKRQTDR